MPSAVPFVESHRVLFSLCAIGRRSLDHGNPDTSNYIRARRKHLKLGSGLINLFTRTRATKAQSTGSENQQGYTGWFGDSRALGK